MGPETGISGLLGTGWGGSILDKSRTDGRAIRVERLLDSTKVSSFVHNHLTLYFNHSRAQLVQNRVKYFAIEEQDNQD